jgi:hypothetical protein
MTETSDTALVVTEARSTRSGRDLAIRVFVTAADLALAVWFWTQSLIGARGFPAGAIGDQLHAATGSANFYLPPHPSTANCKFGSHRSAGALSFVAMDIQKGGSTISWFGDRARPATNHAGTRFPARPAECHLALSHISVFASDLWRCP